MSKQLFQIHVKYLMYPIKEKNHNGCLVYIKREASQHYDIVYHTHTERCKWKEDDESTYSKNWIIPTGYISKLLYT